MGGIRFAAGLVALAASFGSLPFFVLSQNALEIYYYRPTCPCIVPAWVLPTLVLEDMYPLVLTPLLLFLFFYSIRSKVQLAKAGLVLCTIALFMLIMFFANFGLFLLLSPLSNALALTVGLALGWKSSDKISPEKLTARTM